MVKQKKSGKKQVRKATKKRYTKQIRTTLAEDWEGQILVHILSSKYPITASQLQAEIGIKQPIAFKILNKLKDLDCVGITDREDKLGPKRVYYAPTLWGLYYTCFMEFMEITRLNPERTVNERLRKVGTLQRFDTIYVRWLMNPVFVGSIEIFPEYGTATPEVRETLKEHCILFIKSQVAYEEIKNDLPMFWRNLIGGSIVAQREKKWHKETSNRLAKYLPAVRKEIETMITKGTEIIDDISDEK